MKKLTWNDKNYKGAIILNALDDAGIDISKVQVFSAGLDFNLQVVIHDDADGVIEQAVNAAVADYNEGQLTPGERRIQDREQIVNLFGLDAEDRTFIRDLSQVFTLAESNQVGAARVYDEIKAVVDASDKHRVGVAYWYNLEYGINLLGGITLTVADKRRYVQCVRRYYASKLAPALIVWLTR